MSKEQMITNLEYHECDEHQEMTCAALRIATIAYAEVIARYVPEGRAKSLAHTKLEECLMWAIKGVVAPGA